MARTDHLYMPEGHMEDLYSSKNPLVRYVHRNRLQAIASRIPKSGSLAVLDAGCGEGHLLSVMMKHAPNHRYVGIDVSENALIGAKKRVHGASILSGDITKMPFPDASFDVVASTEVIEHVYEYREFLSEIKRILVPGGLCILTFPNEFLWTVSRFFLGRRPIIVPDHVNQFSPARMRIAFGIKPTWGHGLPFKLPFAISLGWIVEFKKDNSVSF